MKKFLIIVFITLLTGCGNDPDTVIVDFKKTTVVDQPENQLIAEAPLRVAVGAMISPKETLSYYRRLLDYIGDKLGRNVQLIQRKTYEEVNELFRKGFIDLAFICSGPYATGKVKYGFEILATPQVRGSPFYHSYLIVNSGSPNDSLEKLKGKVFAFTDPDSNTGRLVPLYWLYQMRQRPETYFEKTIYTYSHDNSILAVGRGLVDGAAVDSLIWEYYQQNKPSFTGRTRVIKKSEPYGIPPLVVSRNMSPSIKEKIRKVVILMHQEPKGQEILKELMIDRFVTPDPEWYDNIARMARLLSMNGDQTHAFSKP